MSQRRKITREVSLGRLPEAALAANGVSLDDMRRVFDVPVQMDLPLEPEPDPEPVPELVPEPVPEPVPELVPELIPEPIAPPKPRRKRAAKPA